MRIITKGGELPYRLFTFPDGQPHFELLRRDEWFSATIEAAITSPKALVDVLLAKDTLDASGYVTSLDVRYLMGARMDRRINLQQPFTLAVLARTLNLAGFKMIRVLDPHSMTTTTGLDAEDVYPIQIVQSLLRYADPSRTVLVAPDAGATPRVQRILSEIDRGERFHVIQGVKHRDAQTGVLSGFSVEDPSRVAGKECLILDDICDGGGTFAGLAAKLTEAGARAVDLFVTHGIFSKGTRLDGLRMIHTTDSYSDRFISGPGFLVHPIRMSDIP